MILVDKIIALRKKNGWSQEELAEKMSVSRQAVSKWEGAQSIPDLEKILKLSRLFGVNTDYLLRDELEEANEFLRIKQHTTKPIAWGVFLCILSPICLLLLVTGCEFGPLFLSEEMACALGLLVLLLMVAAAAALFLTAGA